MRYVRLASGAGATWVGLVLIAAATQSALAQTTFTQRVLSPNAPQPTSVVTVDIDRDGDADVVAAEYSLNGVVWYENSGAKPPAWTKHVVDGFAAGPITVAVGDVDRDGDADIFSANFNDEGIAWYENPGSTALPWTKRVISNFWGDPWAVNTADVDGDGDIDAIGGLTNAICGPPIACVGVEWYENDGATPPTFAIRPVSSGLVGASSVQGADVDGDGDTDILSVDTGSDRILWYENGGGHPPAWTPHVITAAVNDPWALFAIDLDRDGDVDVVSASSEDDRVAWHENDGGTPPRWTTRDIATNRDGALSIHAADLDGDGDADVIAGGWNDSTIAWYESDGTATPHFTEHVIATCGGPEGILAARVDGDADVDVLCAANPGSKIFFFDNDADYADSDGDGVRNSLDCAPGDAAAFASPQEVRNVRFLTESDLRWGPASLTSGVATVHDVVRGSIADLRLGSVAGETCLAAGAANASLTDGSLPAVGAGFYYLVRGRNPCGVGSYGFATTGAERTSSICP